MTCQISRNCSQALDKYSCIADIAFSSTAIPVCSFAYVDNSKCKEKMASVLAS